MNKREYLLDQIEKKIQVFQTDSHRHKTMYRNLRYALFVLTSISTLLAGLSLKFAELSPFFSVAIVVVSATIGVLTSIEGLRKPAELWIHERTTYYALMDLQREVEFKLDASSSAAMVEKYFFRLQDILGASGEKWTRSVAGVPRDHVAAPGDAPLPT